MSESANTDMATEGKTHALANDSLRETAKWIVVGTFASLSAVLAGSSFSSVGALFAETVNWERVLIAAVGGALGLFGLIRLTFDALSVLTFEQFSLAQYAFGEFDSGASQPGGGTQAENADRGPKVRLPRTFAQARDRELMLVLRDRINRQFRAEWPEGIADFEQFARLNLLAEESRNAIEIEGETALIFREGDSLVARSGGQIIRLPETTPLQVDRIAPGTLRVSGKSKRVTFTIVAEGERKGQPELASAGRTITREDIDYFSHATYLACMFNKVSLRFERMQRRLPINIVLILLGFLPMIAAINPPEVAQMPMPQQEIIETEYDGDGLPVRQTTRIVPIPSPQERSIVPPPD